MILKNFEIYSSGSEVKGNTNIRDLKIKSHGFSRKSMFSLSEISVRVKRKCSEFFKSHFDH